MAIKALFKCVLAGTLIFSAFSGWMKGPTAKGLSMRNPGGPVFDELAHSCGLVPPSNEVVSGSGEMLPNGFRRAADSPPRPVLLNAKHQGGTKDRRSAVILPPLPVGEHKTRPWCNLCLKAHQDPWAPEVSPPGPNQERQ